MLLKNNASARDGARIPSSRPGEAAPLEVADAETPGETPAQYDGGARIVDLPPMTVAAIHVVGQDENGNHAECVSACRLDEFISKSNLREVYPAARCFGFNNPDAIPDDDPRHGYERWISIPDDMDVPAPFIKKRHSGGLYAARTIREGAWDEGWLPLHRWVENNSDRYIWRWGSIEGAFNLCGWLEEHLDYWHRNDDKAGKAANQIDLLMPIQPRFAAGTGHPQEKIVETLQYNGIPVEVVEWGDTLWCGSMGCADDNEGEPNVGKILKRFSAMDASASRGRMEPDWDACVSVNYLSSARPNGVMFGFLVDREAQIAGADVRRFPGGRYMRVSLGDETAFAVGESPWRGGILPYQWIGRHIAPAFGYEYGADTLPIFEYYGHYQPDQRAHKYRYLYVPVRKR